MVFLKRRSPFTENHVYPVITNKPQAILQCAILDQFLLPFSLHNKNYVACRHYVSIFQCDKMADEYTFPQHALPFVKTTLCDSLVPGPQHKIRIKTLTCGPVIDSVFNVCV
jgi:hypothetical protein